MAASVLCWLWSSAAGLSQQLLVALTLSTLAMQRTWCLVMGNLSLRATQVWQATQGGGVLSLTCIILGLFWENAQLASSWEEAMITVGDTFSFQSQQSGC